MAEVFISYARVNQGFVRDLNNALQKLKRDTWIDWRSIPDSAEWRGEIFAAIDAADNFLFIISPDSLRSEMWANRISLRKIRRDYVNAMAVDEEDDEPDADDDDADEN